MTLHPGEPVPDFAIVDEHGQDVRLRDALARRPVLLVFFPWAFSRICGSELAELRDRVGELTALGVELLAVSTDPFFSLRAWAEQERFGFRLLSDFWPHGEVARAYGVFHDELGVATRGTFLIGQDSLLRWSVVAGIGDSRSVDDYVGAVRAQGGH